MRCKHAQKSSNYIFWCAKNENGDETSTVVHVYANGRTIVVKNADAEIFVYDAMGKLMCRDVACRVRTELQVNTAGVYIVKVGDMAKRVVVNW